MLKAILPIAVGAVLGAFVVAALPKSERADYEPVAEIGTADPLPPTETEAPEPLSLGDPDAASRREIALSLLHVRGYSAADIDEISTTVPPIEAVNFRIDAIVALSNQDVQSALASAMLLADAEQRRLALRRLAQSLAERDPIGAVSSLNAIDSAALERIFVAELLDNWAIVDPDQALAYLEDSGDVRIPLAEQAFDLLAERDPERLLRLADGLVADVRTAAIAAAFGTFIERDPLAALSRIEELATGPDRSRLEREVARVYGEQNPDEAWRWADETNADANTRMLVLAGIQSVDPAHALDLMMADLTGVDADRRAQMRQRVGSYFYDLLDSGTSTDIVFALDRVLSQDSSLEANMQQFLGTWANDDPEAAFEWSLQNLDRIDPDRMLASIGRSLARENPERVRQALFRLPEDERAPWVAGVGRTLAESDLAAARDWAYEFPRGALRDAALYEYMSSEAHGGSVEIQEFGQFSSDAARGQAAGEVAFRLACDGHTALATEIASTQIADPDLRALTERRMEGTAGGSPNIRACRMIRP
jgi:hypothetical protein